MAAQEAKQFLTKVWDSMWSSSYQSSTLSDYLTEDVEFSVFTPPKQTTFKGIPEIAEHFKEVNPIIEPKSFVIKRLDLVQDSTAFYADYEATLNLKVPGQEGEIVAKGIMYCTREGGKVKVLTAYEDPTPFVAMAAKGVISA